MKNTILVKFTVAVGLLVLGFGLLTSKLDAASANANVNASIQTALTISKNNDLDFVLQKKLLLELASLL